MKNYLIAFILIFSWPLVIYGQPGIAVSGGINYSSISYDKLGSSLTNARVGYFLGIAPYYSFGQHFNLVLGVQYSQKGFSDEIGFGNDENYTRYAYLDFIPEIEFKPIKILTLGAGVNYGFLINEKAKFGDSEWVKIEGDYKSAEPSDFGLTFKVKAEIEQFFVFLRYNLGMDRQRPIIFTDDAGQALGLAHFKNRNFQLGVGYQIF